MNFKIRFPKISLHAFIDRTRNFIREQKSKPEQVIFWGGALVCIVLSLAWSASQESEDETNAAKSKVKYGIDTAIPKGMVLIPIKVQNADGLRGLVDTQGVVDLYATRDDGKHSTHAIAQRVKMLRSSDDESQWNILYPQNEAGRILAHDGAFFVAVQNPEADGTVVPKQNYGHSRIQME